MRGFLFDSIVLLDIITRDSAWRSWSKAQVETALEQDQAFINPIIYAELAPEFASADALDNWLDSGEFQRLTLSYTAGWRAAKAFARYRRAGGTRPAPLPDFYIGQELRTVRACSLLDEVCHDGIGEVTFEAVPAFDFAAPALEFEFDERTQAAEEMVADGLFAAHKEPFGMADLLDGTMIALHGPVLPVGMVEGVPSHFHALFFRGSKAA